MAQNAYIYIYIYINTNTRGTNRINRNKIKIQVKCTDVMHTHKYQVISIKYQTIKILEFHFTKLKHNLLDNTGVITRYLTDNTSTLLLFLLSS